MSIFDSLLDPFRTPTYSGNEDENIHTGYDYDIGKIIGTGTAALGAAGQVADLFGYDLFGGGGGGRGPSGYQGKIPTYTATRTQVPNTYDPDRRPGSGGQRYFTDVSYAGGDPTAEAAGLAALNRANLAAQNRQGQQLAPIRAAQDAAAAQAATQAAQPTQQIASGGIVGYAAGRKINVPENTSIQQAAFKSNKPITKRKMKDGTYGLFQGNVYLGPAEEGSGFDLGNITGDIGEQVDRLKEAGGKALSYIGFAEGGIAGLKEGKYLDGATDGMADEKPAMIDGEQPAALSDGEFVIPADVVSHLGNGNSDAGAKVLEDMMDRVRKARTGSTKQGKEIDPEEFLPA
tara:strand:- start:1414 stop:2451 length:1038 start_codon:yes stop_codon:yes gene_type:complete